MACNDGFQRTIVDIKAAFLAVNELESGDSVTVSLAEWKALEAAIVNAEPVGLAVALDMVVPL
jgi:hypothetical protein